MEKQYLIAEILLERGLPDLVVKEITKLGEHELFFLKNKWNNSEEFSTDFQIQNKQKSEAPGLAFFYLKIFIWPECFAGHFFTGTGSFFSVTNYINMVSGAAISAPPKMTAVNRTLHTMWHSIHSFVVVVPYQNVQMNPVTTCSIYRRITKI